MFSWVSKVNKLSLKFSKLYKQGFFIKLSHMCVDYDIWLTSSLVILIVRVKAGSGARITIRLIIPTYTYREFELQLVNGMTCSQVLYVYYKYVPFLLQFIETVTSPCKNQKPKTWNITQTALFFSLHRRPCTMHVLEPILVTTKKVFQV